MPDFGVAAETDGHKGVAGTAAGGGDVVAAEAVGVGEGLRERKGG